MARALEVARYLIKSLPMDNLKLQKLLYYSQATHLVLHNKACLFPEQIEAWDYGPVVPKVYHEYKSHGFDIIPTPNRPFTLPPEEKKSADIVIKTYGNMSGPKLIKQTHYEWPWRNAYRPERPSNIISIDSMYEYFRETMDIPEIETCIPYGRNIIKTSFFKTLKDCTYLLIHQNDDVNYSENPSVDIETIARSNGITHIQRVLPSEVRHKHALLIGSVIFLNEQDSPKKQRFSIAHEIFHFLTRQDNNNDLMEAVARQGETWKRENADSYEAIEEEIADYFAANLLIPTERFILWEDKPDEDIAQAFGVEPKCIRTRREEIEYELICMAPQDISSDIKIEEQVPLSLDELGSILGGHSIHGSGRS